LGGGRGATTSRSAVVIGIRVDILSTSIIQYIPLWWPRSVLLRGPCRDKAGKAHCCPDPKFFNLICDDVMMMIENGGIIFGIIEKKKTVGASQSGPG
jgi:hypothetical protein